MQNDTAMNTKMTIKPIRWCNLEALVPWYDPYEHYHSGVKKQVKLTWNWWKWIWLPGEGENRNASSDALSCLRTNKQKSFNDMVQPKCLY